MIPRKEFDQLVKDGLSKLYDPIHLQTHPLAELLVPERRAGETIGEALRSTLRETIDALKPPASAPVTRPEWMAYRVLRLHYVRSFRPEQVCAELGLSLSSFYRRQREALAAVSSVLWNQCRASGAAQQAERAPALGHGREDVVGLASSLPRVSISVHRLLRGVERTIRPLAERRGVALRVRASTDLPPVHGTPSILRQVILCMLGEAMSLLESGQTLSLSVSLNDGETLWEIGSPDGLLEPEALVSGSGEIGLCRGLLGAHGGRIWTAEAGDGKDVALFTIPVAHLPLILVVDDDQHAVELYRRYLPDHNLIAARTAKEVRQRLGERKPDLILLDVILPQEDGWVVLQSLKGNRDTAHIPVIVCSIIAQARLALALGAVDVLSKPIAPAELVSAVRRWLLVEDNSDSAYPAEPASA